MSHSREPKIRVCGDGAAFVVRGSKCDVSYLRADGSWGRGTHDGSEYFTNREAAEHCLLYGPQGELHGVAIRHRTSRKLFRFIACAPGAASAGLLARVQGSMATKFSAVIETVPAAEIAQQEYRGFQGTVDV
jgi:hypothetical protein